jgi:hypothetical protein
MLLTITQITSQKTVILRKSINDKAVTIFYTGFLVSVELNAHSIIYTVRI